MKANFGYDPRLIFRRDQLPLMDPCEIEYLVASGLDLRFTRYAEPATSGLYRELNAADLLRRIAWEMN